MKSATASISSVVALVADEYLDQLARGEVPDIDGYAQRYPKIASVLPQVLPALKLIHEISRETNASAVQPADFDVLDDYRIIGEIGRGGMGVVFEAEQVSLGRRVALKVLPSNSGIGTRHLARFQIEAQVAAALHHPNIVPIYAVGCVAGVHYYAMQLIEGQCLAELLAGSNRVGPGDAGAAPPALREADVRTPTPLLPREVACLGMQAAEALEHAHSLGVLHRDIKPANLLVDQSGHLWVADFGLAGVQGGGDITQSGDLVGTLRYMSPEQAAGGRILDPRTDVYSLGVTLYELLTSRPAFDGRDRQELLHQIAATEPIPIRKWNPAVPRDLETVVAKAIAKEPHRRYDTALELADDLRRFLDDRPVLARRPGVLERAARLLRRHRRAATSIAALVVLAGMASAGGMVRLWREQQKTLSALVSAKVARANEREALLFTFAASDQIAQRALLLIAAPKPAQSGVEGERDQEFCRNALDYYAAIARRYDCDVEMQPIAAAAYHRVGFIQMILADPRAEDTMRHSIALFERLAVAAPASEDFRNQLALAYHDLVVLLRSNHRLASNLDCYRRLVAVRRRLTEDFPARREYRISLTYDLAELGDLLEGAGQSLEAADVRRSLQANYLAILQDDPDDSRTRNNLAWMLASRADESNHDASRAVELAEGAVKRAPSEGLYWNTLGLARYRAGQWKGATEALEKSARLRSGGDAYDWLLLAMARWQLGDRIEARCDYDRSVAWITKNAPDNQELARFRSEATRLIGLEARSKVQARRF
jgi:serine/threonine protein kinase